MTNKTFNNVPDYSKDPEGFKQWADQAKPRFRLEESKWSSLGLTRHRSKFDRSIPRFTLSSYGDTGYNSRLDSLKRRVNSIRDYLLGPLNRWDYRRKWSISMDEMAIKVQEERDSIADKFKQLERERFTTQTYEKMMREDK